MVILCDDLWLLILTGADINVSSSQAAPALDNDGIELPDEVEDDEDDEE